MGFIIAIKIVTVLGLVMGFLAFVFHVQDIYVLDRITSRYLVLFCAYRFGRTVTEIELRTSHVLDTYSFIELCLRLVYCFKITFYGYLCLLCRKAHHFILIAWWHLN